MVRIENQRPGQCSETSVQAGERLIVSGAAMATCRIDGLLCMIRMNDPVQNLQASTRRGYDEVDRSFHREAPRLPLIAADKMIREEKSSRDWSFQAGAGRFRGILSRAASSSHGREETERG